MSEGEAAFPIMTGVCYALRFMQPPAIQAALDNLVETVRTALMAEFLELLRDGKPAAPKRKRKSTPAATKKVAKARRPR